MFEEYHTCRRGMGKIRGNIRKSCERRKVSVVKVGSIR